MTSINIHRGNNGGEIQKPPPLESGSLLRNWRDIRRWDPFAQMMPVWSDEVQTLFSPDFDVKETKDAFLFKVDLPGVKKEDVEVQLTDNRLTIAGKRLEEEEEKTDTTYRSERSFGSFSQVFTLPTGAEPDKVDAELKQGVLTVKVPKRPEAKGKQVTIKSA